MTEAERALVEFVVNADFTSGGVGVFNESLGKLYELRDAISSQRLNPEVIQEAERVNEMYHAWKAASQAARKQFGDARWTLACSNVQKK